MLRELKTSLLTPRNYYELYMKVTDELRHVEDFFQALNKQGTPVVEMYEKVQHCANVVPRLYLLIAVGGVYIKSGEVRTLKKREGRGKRREEERKEEKRREEKRKRKERRRKRKERKETKRNKQQLHTKRATHHSY